MSNQAVVFVSDAHFALQLDAAERQRRGSFLQFLDSLQGVERLIVVEDVGRDAVRVVPGLAVAPSRRAAG